MDLDNLFKKILEKNKEFQEVLKIVKRNSLGGGIWIVGGTVYKNLVQELYGGLDMKGILKQKMDFDFIVENLVEFDKIFFPENWNVKINTNGHPKLFSKKSEIDLISLRKMPYIMKNNLEPIVDNYFKCCFVDIQAIAFDLVNEKLVGKLGIDAIENRKIRVINSEELKRYCGLKGVNPSDYLERLSKSLKLEFTS